MSVVIIGASHSGFQCATSLREVGYDGVITLVGEEPFLPYHRPPLSKAYLKGEQDADGLLLRPSKYYADKAIDLRLGVRATALDAEAQTVRLDDDTTLSFDALVLATGARPRALPVSGAHLAGVFALRDRVSSDAIKAHMDNARDVVIIGAGFIGLEIAATAALLKKRVQVVEMQDRVMARVIPPVLSDYFEGLHGHHGVELHLNTGVTKITGKGGRVAEVVCTDDRALAADMVVVGIGVIPNVELAEAAGLPCDDGIVVDAHLRTERGSIYAIGDVARHPSAYATSPIRLESVQNALDQGRCAAANICGPSKVYKAVPWFWSDQYATKLQIVGLSTDHDTYVVRGDTQGERFSICYYKGDTLVAIDSVNAPADHMAGRHLLARGLSPSVSEVSNVDVRLKSYLRT